MNVTEISGPLSAFLAGMVTSLHCAGMCGPLACSIAPKPGASASFNSVAASYQLARILSYTLIGVIAGGTGMIALGWLSVYQHSVARFLPWALVLYFLAIALNMGSAAPKIPLISRLYAISTRQTHKLTPVARGGLIGFLTPLLPCAPLYGAFGLALMTQSPIKGAEFMLPFALGTLPLLYIVQASFARWQGILKPVTIKRIQRSLALVVATILGIRLYIFETGAGGLFCGE